MRLVERKRKVGKMGASEREKMREGRKEGRKGGREEGRE